MAAWRTRPLAAALCLGLPTLVACGVSGAGKDGVRPTETGGQTAAVASSQFRDFAILGEFPHDSSAYTQGLFFHKGFLFEGTGRFGQSSLRRVELESGSVLQKASLQVGYFGEGVAVLDGRIYQLTWRSRQGFVYDEQTFEPEGKFQYETEGWGLTSDGKHLIMSDGTASLYFLDPVSFEVMRTLSVHDADGPVQMLNELELVEGVILANVWQRDVILEISPETGAVTAKFDLSGLVAYEGARSPEAVLNGIAYDAATKRLFVTGKLWSRVYEVELKRR